MQPQYGEARKAVLHPETTRGYFLPPKHDEWRRTIVADVAVAVAGCAPTANSMGPFTMPPPTPNVPAMRPAN